MDRRGDEGRQRQCRTGGKPDRRQIDPLIGQRATNRSRAPPSPATARSARSDNSAIDNSTDSNRRIRRSTSTPLAVVTASG